MMIDVEALIADEERMDRLVADLLWDQVMAARLSERPPVEELTERAGLMRRVQLALLHLASEEQEA